jgi:hypothetical protein
MITPVDDLKMGGFLLVCAGDLLIHLYRLQRARD